MDETPDTFHLDNLSPVKDDIQDHRHQPFKNYNLAKIPAVSLLQRDKAAYIYRINYDFTLFLF